MDRFTKHTDAIIVIGAIVGSMMWMNTKFNDLEKDMAVIKTVLIMKDIMPSQIAKAE